MKNLLLSLVAVGLVGCSSTRSTVQPVALGPGSTIPQKEATLVAGRSGAYVALQPRGTLTVDLQSNPGAGYRWKLVKPLDESVLKLVSGQKALPPIALAPAGLSLPQPEKWVFQAVGPGTQKVRMIYARPDRPLNESVTYDFTVNAE